MNIFDKWDNEIDTEGLQNDIKEAAENGGTGNYKEVEPGQYEVSVEKMELKASKKGDPMVSIWFKILEGEFKNSLIFMNQVITQGFQVHIVNELLRAMTAECADVPEIEFKGYKQYAELLMDVHEAIADNFEYALNYEQNKKGFNTFEIIDVFVLE